jgi:mono/diheme cytochrome c family protein
MKPKHLLTILPIVALLTGCGQTEISLNPNAAGNLAAPQLTATPAELVVWPNDRPSIPDGKVVFQQNCATCHSAGGSAADVKFDATWAHQVKPLDIYRTIAFGGTDTDLAKRRHPAFAQKLNVNDLWNAVVYTRSLGQPALDDKTLAEVDPVFGSNCAVCHGTKGDGDGPLARNLEPMPANFQRFDRFFNRSDDVLFDHIANGIRWEGMPNFLGKKDGKKNVHFDEAYIRKLVQYVHKFHVNNNPVLTANAAAPSAAPAAAAGTSPTAGAAPAGTNGSGPASTSGANATGGQTQKGAQ